MAQTKTCPRCKTKFTSDSPRKKYCNTTCTNAAAQERYKARQSGTEVDEDEGDEDVEETDEIEEEEEEEPTATIVDAGDVDVAALYALAVSVGLDPVQVLLEAVLEARRGRSS